MKKHGKLWDRITTPENLKEALRLSLRKKKHKGNIKNVIDNKEKYLKRLENMLKTEGFKPTGYANKLIFEPKLRILYAAPFYPDRIVHHAIMNVLEPIYEGFMSSKSFSCRKNKGQHVASTKCMRYAQKFDYCLQCDCSQFYINIDHEIMKRLYRWKIKDKKLLEVLDSILMSVPTRQNNIRILKRLIEKGVSVEQAKHQLKKLEFTNNLFDNALSGEPIGNLLSQWDGNLYMTEFDHWVSKELKCKAYIRFCDDFVFFSNDKKQLGEWKEKIRKFLFETRKLVLSKAEVFPTSQGVDFCGYRHFHNGKLLVRKRTAQRAIRRVKGIIKEIDEKRITPDSARSVMGSTWGILKHAKTYNLRKSVNFDAVYKEVADRARAQAIQ